MKSTHTRKEALSGEGKGSPQTDGSPLETHSDPMPDRSTVKPMRGDSLDVGDGVAGLGPMPWGKAH